MSAPITLTLYGPDDEPLKTYQRSIVPWGVLKRAVQLNSEIDQANVSEDDLDRIAEFVVLCFGDQFTVADLNDGADIGDMLAVLRAVTNRSTAVINPTVPPVSKKR